MSDSNENATVTETAPEAPKTKKAKKKKSAKPVESTSTERGLWGVRQGSVRDFYNRALYATRGKKAMTSKELAAAADELAGYTIPGGAGRIGAYLAGMLPGVKGFQSSGLKLVIDRSASPHTFTVKAKGKQETADESAPLAREESPEVPSTETAPEAPVS